MPLSGLPLASSFSLATVMGESALSHSSQWKHINVDDSRDNPSASWLMLFLFLSARLQQRKSCAR